MTGACYYVVTVLYYTNERKEKRFSLICKVGSGGIVVSIKPKTGKDSTATFVIKIHHRQNSTWQGQIQWLEANISKNFRSCLEMMKLIDEGVNLTNMETDRDTILVDKW